MSILSPLSSLPITHEDLVELLASKAVTDPYPHLLRWLVWFPLLTASELIRLEQARMAKLEQICSPQKVSALLRELEEFGLIAHLIVNEPGWPPHQHRYFLTDAGLYVFAAQSDPPLSVPQLAQAYAVERADLITRLARIDIHLVLADFSTRLVAEGSSTQGSPLMSFQQPWMQTDTIFGHRQTFRCDAAFLLADQQGTDHAFYVRVDTDEHRPFDSKQERTSLLRLLNLRQALHLQRETMPRLLIITSALRLAAWGTLLGKISEPYNTALLDGAITTLEHMRRSGVHGPLWWTFVELVNGMNNGHLDLPAPSIPLIRLLGDPASQIVAERFSQRRTFAHLVTERNRSPLRKTSRPLPSYVGKPLTNEIDALHTAELIDALSGTKAEQQEATALLNLALSATQKELLFWLTHHQLLTMHHLATLHYPGGRDRRGMQKQMGGLFSLNLLVPFAWYSTRPWHERERYLLAESALRYVALRERKQATYYLLPQEDKKKNGVQALSIQRGTVGLFAQMEHTHGLYECMTRLLEEAHHENIRLFIWKSAHEAIRGYRDPFTTIPMQIRPDAEVIYQVEGQTIPQSILVEYDRATTTKREYEAKYQSYADYQDYTHLTLPPILVVTQDKQAAALIRTCIDRIGSKLAFIIILEDHIQHQGLLTMLTLLDRPQ